MLISKKRNFIFIHIYKTAGTSITSALMPFTQGTGRRIVNRVLKKINFPSLFFDPQPYEGHIKAFEIIEAMGSDAFNSFFSFAFVRNPWDWNVSLYNFILKEKNHPQHDFVKKFGDFGEYIEWRCENWVTCQKEFICSKHNELLVDFVGKYENINADFKKICSHIGISASLPILNVSKTQPYQQYYTKKTSELVRQTFESDIELFEYDF